MILDTVYQLTDYDIRTGLQPQRFVLSFDSGNFGTTIITPTQQSNLRTPEVPDAKVFVITHLVGIVRGTGVISAAGSIRLNLRIERAGVPAVALHNAYVTYAAGQDNPNLFIDHDAPDVIMGPEEYIRMDIDHTGTLTGTQFWVTASGYLVPRGNVIT